MCERLDIKSSKDTEKLKKAKDEVYLKGFYEGVMLVGECKGMKVCDAKPVIRQSLIDRGDAMPYFEPESLVMSRSGDEVSIRIKLFVVNSIVAPVSARILVWCI
jgi:leucyl-tRNA synthetase